MSSFALSRETTIDAPRERVHGILDDFRHWPRTQAEAA